MAKANNTEKIVAILEQRLRAAASANEQVPLTDLRNLPGMRGLPESNGHIQSIMKKLVEKDFVRGEGKGRGVKYFWNLEAPQVDVNELFPRKIQASSKPGPKPGAKAALPAVEKTPAAKTPEPQFIVEPRQNPSTTSAVELLVGGVMITISSKQKVHVGRNEDTGRTTIIIE